MEAGALSHMSDLSHSQEVRTRLFQQGGGSGEHVTVQEVLSPHALIRVSQQVCDVDKEFEPVVRARRALKDDGVQNSQSTGCT